MVTVKLAYKDKIFEETSEKTDTSDVNAILEIDDANQKATLTYSPDAGLIDKRTAQRQAQGICKTGFMLANGQRVGVQCELVIAAEEKLPDRLLQEGYKYK